MMSENGFSVILYGIVYGAEYYRDKDNREIDIIIEDNAVLYPIEIKAHADPAKRDIKQFDLLDKIAQRGEGGVVCMTS